MVWHQGASCMQIGLISNLVCGVLYYEGVLPLGDEVC